MRLQNRVALIVGAARGIGRATAQLFSREGADLVLADIQEEEVRALADALRGQGRKALPIQVDVCLSQEVGALVDYAIKEMGRIDILVNSAGGGKYVPMVEMTEKDWDEMMDFNLKSVFLCCRALFPHMISQRYGRIINIACWRGEGPARPEGSTIRRRKRASWGSRATSPERPAPMGPRSMPWPLAPPSPRGSGLSSLRSARRPSQSAPPSGAWESRKIRPGRPSF